MSPRAYIAGEFRLEGWTVSEAGTGVGAIEWLRNVKTIDLLITDIRLADATTGWEVAEVARELHPESAVIYASGATNNNGRQVSRSVFLGKPVTALEIMRAYRRVPAGTG